MLRHVVRNTGWNLLGNLAPAIAAVACLPWLANALGVERFGYFLLVWTLIGYFSVLDFGFGRAITRVIAAHDENAREDLSGTVSRITKFLFTVTVAVAVVCSAVLLAGMDNIPNNGFRRFELVITALIVLAALPATCLISIYRGMLEGYGRFRSINYWRAILGVLILAVPSVAMLFSPTLYSATLSILIVRLLSLWIHRNLARRECTALFVSNRRGSKETLEHNLRAMRRFAGWLTVTNLVGPVIVYVDRFIITALLGAQQAAFYSAPFEAISRLLLLPLSFTSALFPSLTRVVHNSKREGYTLLLRSIALTGCMVMPFVVLGLLGASWLLNLWLGQDFAANGSAVTQILLIGLAFNAIAQVPYTVLHSLGKSRQTALVHLIELPLYIPLLIYVVGAWGILGAAVCWTIRASCDFFVMFLLARSQLRKS